MLRRLARELSDRMGAVVLAIGVEREGRPLRLLERGPGRRRVPLLPGVLRPAAPGEVVGLAANPPAVDAADGRRSEAPDGSPAPRGPAELPPAPELLAELAEALGLQGAGHGYARRGGIPGARVLGR